MNYSDEIEVELTRNSLLREAFCKISTDGPVYRMPLRKLSATYLQAHNDGTITGHIADEDQPWLSIVTPLITRVTHEQGIQGIVDAENALLGRFLQSALSHQPASRGTYLYGLHFVSLADEDVQTFVDQHGLVPVRKGAPAGCIGGQYQTGGWVINLKTSQGLVLKPGQIISTADPLNVGMYCTNEHHLKVTSSYVERAYVPVLINTEAVWEGWIQPR